MEMVVPISEITWSGLRAASAACRYMFAASGGRAGERLVEAGDGVLHVGRTRVGQCSMKSDAEPEISEMLFGVNDRSEVMHRPGCSCGPPT